MKKKPGCGCCAGLLIMSFVFATLIVIAGAVMLSIQNSQHYKAAVTAAQEHPRAVELLGQPIEGGWLVTNYSVERGNGTGTANLTVPVSGPNGSGQVRYGAVYKDGEWEKAGVFLKVDGHEQFSLGQ